MASSELICSFFRNVENALNQQKGNSNAQNQKPHKSMERIFLKGDRVEKFKITFMKNFLIYTFQKISIINITSYLN